MAERWKFIRGTDDKYAVSTLGRVAAVKDGKLDHLIKPIDDGGTKADGSDGKTYQYVDIQQEGRAHHSYLHQLVAEAFCPEYYEGCIVDHKDHNRHNNRVENLNCTSSSENNKHSYSYGDKYI